MKSRIHTYTLLSISLLCIVIMMLWLGFDPTSSFGINEPGLDEVPDKTEEESVKIEIGSDFSFFKGIETNLTGKWPGFRGPDADNIVKDNIRLISSFGSQGPKILWEKTLGEGHAAPAIYNGRVYILDYMETEKQEALRCLSLETGEELWRRSYDIHIKRNHGMSRTIPAVTEDHVVTMGALGHVMCVERESGNLKWSLDLVSMYDSEIPFWYTGQCPLIVDGVAIIATGGKNIMIGVDCATGEIEWECTNPAAYQMSHSSVMIVDLHGIPMYVYSAIGGIVGVSARKSDRGKLLWHTNAFDPSVIAPSPVKTAKNEILFTAGYGAGSIILNIDKNMKVEVVDRFKPKEGLASEQQTPVVLGERIYGILPKDAGQLRNQFVCYNMNDLRNPLWSSGKEHRFGLGPYIYADNKFYILSDDGTMSIARVSEVGYVELGKSRIMEGNDAWGPIAIADGKLLMRDSKKMLCLDIRA